MTAIVCVSQSWGIGRDGALLFRISADHKRFRALTVGKTVILGHKTLDTFPGGKPSGPPQHRPLPPRPRRPRRGDRPLV